MSQQASIIETLDLGNVLTSNNSIQLATFTLAQFNRALQVSQFYKWYKAEYVEWEYLPFADTYQDGATTGASVPYFYSIMNRTQDLTAPSSSAGLAQWVEGQGAIPRKFIKKIVIRYKPNWCAPGLIMNRLENTPSSVNGIGMQGMTPHYGWLASPMSAGVAGSVQTTRPIIPPYPGSVPAGFTETQDFPQGVVYNGHMVYIDQFTGQGERICKAVLRVKWVFKNPAAYYVAPPPGEPAPEVVA